ncbi:MAG: polymerase, sigma 32 subunit, RpoH, partial [Solirubrobacterales bacterium]|nr:polymerase, sigma 32 subunit, RpoH [Solirubrobacterales bacterium]
SLPLEEELLLVVAAQRPDGAAEREELVDMFQPLIGSVARLYRNTSAVTRTELMQEGTVGLLRALARFDPEHGSPFWSYASWWVRQAMQQLVSELSRAVVLSDRALRQLASVKAVQRERQSTQGPSATCDQLAAASGLLPTQVYQLMSAERLPRGLQEPIGRDDSAGATLGDLLADPRAEDAYEEVSDRLDLAVLPRLLQTLTEREALIVCAHYGLDGCEQTLRQLGEGLGLSAERVRQIEQGAMEKMRVAFATVRPAA